MVIRLASLTLCLGLAASVTAAAAPEQRSTLTIAISKRVVVYGSKVRAAGVFRDQAAGTPVFVYLRRQGDRRFAPVSTATVGRRGRWSFTFEPTVRTEIQARSSETASRVVSVRVRPRLTLTRRGLALYARAVGARSFRGRHVWLQRRARNGVWRSLRKVVLDDPPRRFEVELPRGVSRLRISLPRRQAGRGYEPAVSRVLVLRRGRG